MDLWHINISGIEIDKAFFERILEEIERREAFDGNDITLQTWADDFDDVEIETLKHANEMLLKPYPNIQLRIFCSNRKDYIDLENLSYFTNLRCLCLDEVTEIKNDKIPKELVNLEKLIYHVKQVKSFEFLKQFPKLTSLDIGYGKSVKPDISPIGECRNLEELRIEKYKKGIEVISSLKKLKKLYLSNIKLKTWDIFPMQEMDFVWLKTVKAVQPFSYKYVKAKEIKLKNIEVVENENIEKKSYELPFELTNHERKYLGLEPVEDHWDRVFIDEQTLLYFEGDIIKREIVSSKKDYYRECQCNHVTEGRRILLPKTAKGKKKPLTASNLSLMSGEGVYFKWLGSVKIGNFTTQRSLLGMFEVQDDIKSFEDLRQWIENYIKDTSQENLKELEEFKKAKRKHVKYKEGDFFRFKIDRRQYGYGRILIDVDKYRKSEEFKKYKNYGLSNLMTRPLAIKVYHMVGGKEIDLEVLRSKKAFPEEYFMDNNFYYGDCEIIGNLPIEDWEYDFPISFGTSISALDKDTKYLQWGLIYCESHIDDFSNYLSDIKSKTGGTDVVEDIEYTDFRNEGIGFFYIDKEFFKCIEEESNKSYWYKRRIHDLRNPMNEEIKKVIFDFFGLRADLSYSENLTLWLERK